MLPSDDRENVAAKLLKLLAASVAAGVLMSLIVLPAVGSTGITARDAADDFLTMDVVKITRGPAQRSIVYDSEGKQLVQFFDQYRVDVELDKVAPIMQKAIVAIEDSRFFEHGALDLKGTLRALAKNTSSGEVSEGGSTLTQQLAKNKLVNNVTTQEGYKEVTAPTVTRKLRELRLALHLEQTMKKDEILKEYLNIAYFGAGAYGIQAASKRYFNKSASKLTLVEAATLAGITKNPYQLDPTINPDKAVERRNTVLKRMEDLGLVSSADASAAKDSKLKLNEWKPKGGCQTSKSPYFCQYVYGEMIKIFTGDTKGKSAKEIQKKKDDARNELLRGGYTIHTTIDPKIQKAAEEGVRIGGFATATSNKVATQAVVEPGTGKIKAIAVSKKFGPSKGGTTYNLAADLEHGGSNVGSQPGSTFKPFTLLAALDKGIPIRTSLHSPTNAGFTDCDGRTDWFGWKPGNAGGGKGPWNLKTGTWGSVNTFYAALEQKVGLCDSVKMAEKFGLKKINGEPLLDTPAQVLGANEVDSVQMATAYAGIAARGRYCPPVAVTKVTGADGKEFKLPENKCEQVVDEQVADAATQILSGAFSYGTARGLSIGRPAAGKTGTCDNNQCTAFAGFTPQLASALAYWDMRGITSHPVGGFGASRPGPMWQYTMRKAHEGLPVKSFTAPTKDFGDVVIKGIPDVKGKSKEEAEGILRQAGFDVKVSPRPVKSDAPAGTVARTSPSGQADEGSVITIFLSAGKGDGPDDGGNPFTPGTGFWPFN